MIIDELLAKLNVKGVQLRKNDSDLKVLHSQGALDPLLLDELRTHKAALLDLRGQADQLPKPLPFRNFAAQARLGVSREEHELFFRELLGDVDEPTAPFGLLDVQGDGCGIEEASLEVDVDLARQLRGRVQALKVSAASICHLAWALVLARVSGREDVVFGTVLFGRMQGGESADRVMEMFINTLPIKIQIGEEGVEASVKRTHILLMELMRHEHASLALAQRCSRVPAPVPLFSALLSYRHMQGLAQAPSAMQAREGIEGLYGEERTNYPFTISVNDLGIGFSLTAQIQTPIEPLRVCGFMHTALERLVEALETAPNTAVRSLDVLSEAERRQVVVEFNQTQADYPKDCCVHQLFEEQVIRTPAAVALVFEDQSLTYDALNCKANQLAHHLRTLGVGPDTLVGICVERSLEMVIGLLAILKAGGAYVPLDPNYPQERLKFMLEDSEIQVLLTQSSLLSALSPQPSALEVICLDRDTTVWISFPDTNPESLSEPANLAYVIYTSGSTGIPKGVMIPHRAIANHMLWMASCFSIIKTDVVLQKTPFSFDASIWEYYAPLLAGARLILARPGGHQDPAYLLQIIETLDITILQLVPTLLQMIVAAPGLERCLALRKVFCGGEALAPDLVKAFHGCCQAKLVNLYGPTEVTINSIYWECRMEISDKVPIGRPVANTQIYILDTHDQPVPVGVSGELHIGGIQVARGYLNRPELTAEKFIPDPFSTDPNARLFKTGDLARWLADGNIEYLGRIDFQVKIRGFRIELGEIETALTRYAQIREAIVLVREDSPGDKRLVAYIVPSDGSSPDIAGLRTHLKSSLPEYMIPAAFVVLESLPLTPNGKVDRKALPPPAAVRSATDRVYRAPGNEAEQKLAAIWQEVLGLDRIGVEDNFFELGGDSLKAMQVVARIHHVFGIPCPIQALFENPTVAGLQPFIAGRRGSTVAEPVHPIMSAGTRTTYELSGAQKGLWLDCRIQSDPVFYNEQSLLPIRGVLDRTIFVQALAKLIAQQATLRTVFLEKNHETVQRILPGIHPEISLPDFSALGSAETKKKKLEALQVREFKKPFNLSKGPLFRISLVRCGPQFHYLLTTLHHLITDDWSQNEFYNQLFRIYAALSSNRPERAPRPMSLRYVDYSVWHNRLLNAPYGSACRDYWRANLAGADQAPDLSYAEPPAAGGERTAASAVLVLGRKQTEQIRLFGVEQNATLFMTLLAVFKVLLFRYGRQEDITVGVPASLRNRKELENMLGYFVNMLPIRTRLTGDLTFRECLHRVKQKTLEAFQYRDYPFYQMVADLNPQRSGPGHSLLTVTFQTETGTKADQASLAGLRLPEAEWISHVAKYDLSVIAGETDGRIRIRFEYPAALFLKNTINRMREHYGRLVRQLLKGPDQPLQAVDYLSDREIKTLLDRFNRTEALLSAYALTRACAKPAGSRTGQALYRQTDPLLFRELMQQKKYRHWISAKIAVQEVNHWKMLKAAAPIRAGEALIRLKFDLMDKPTRTSLQLHEHMHMEIPGLDVTNHACRPNAYIDFRTLCFRALQDIRAGEEITYNYFTTEWDLSHKFQCLCGSPHCLHTIRGFKYLPAEERERIQEHISPFLKAKIAGKGSGPLSEQKPPALHCLFEQQVKSSWGKPALVCGQTTWTYYQLNRRANQWARWLIQKGLANGSRVALLFENSPEMIVALLAVLKAGSAYVPLDPAYPNQRIRAILESTGASFLLTQKSLKKRIGPTPDVPVLCPDPDGVETSGLEDTDLDQTLKPDSLAYIIHTSGSTGIPKGVGIRQAAVVNYLAWLKRTIFTGYARIPLLNHIAFDASIEQIFGALTNGGTLLIPRDLHDIPSVAGLIAARATAFSVVPSYLNAVIQYWEENAPDAIPGRKIKTIYIGGEELKSDLLAKMRRVFPQAAIFNGYGPTEATVASHYYKIGKDNKVFLGRPIANVHSLILDPHHQLLPIGVKGEIVIGGAGLAEGYLNDPELTAEKFIAHP
jgi:amino acid adenylation domain-containing protein